jgi:RNA-directed DNA polymerase
MIIIHKNFDELFNFDNLLNAWRFFRRGKTGKADVQSFERHLEDNLFDLYEELRIGGYKHRAYKFFQTFDSKKRDIHVAEIRDRIIHRLIYDYLVEIYEPIFISDSYSSRIDKGSHNAVKSFRYFAKLVQTGNSKQCFVLKCDIKKYFQNINSEILLNLLKKQITDEKILKIADEIIKSFSDGIPLGNMTSQIFANIYLHDFDLFIKKVLKVRFYIRYNTRRGFPRGSAAMTLKGRFGNRRFLS